METIPFPLSYGYPQPFGAHLRDNGVNFSIVSAHAKSVTLCLFDNIEQEKPLYEVSFDPILNKTGNVWHIFIQGLPNSYFYLFKINNDSHLLIDPYSHSIVTTHEWGRNMIDGKTRYLPLGSIMPSFEWEGDKLLRIPSEELIIYEMHVRGFTQHSSSKSNHPGTFLGIIEKIPYLKELGINAVELMPIHEFNECEYLKENPITKETLYNFWGYSTVNFFAPMQRYASKGGSDSAVAEFKTMVKELHRNGIEVIIDVVYNHTSEGNGKGPIQSFKGFDKEIYYMMDDKGNYYNFSGCGNTFNCNHPVAHELIQDSLRYWVIQMHVDGFRFDLASILGRGHHGQPLVYSPLVEAISNDPILAGVKLIAEPWDAGGLYQVGTFYMHGGGKWKEWNGRYRDVVRKFIKGTGNKSEFATNICGSQDLYYSSRPSNSINFITAHDGFTLRDLVSYNEKHNEENGEDNKDGTNNNDSWNCGTEGETDNVEVLKLRNRQMRNYHLALMLSRGIPMILMGDEYGHTKKGNNNTWCHDNELNWFLWDQLDKNQEFFRFYKLLIQFRHEHSLLRKDQFLTQEDIDFHGKEIGNPMWGQEDGVLAFTLKDPENHFLYAAFNASANPVEIQLPSFTKEFSWFWVLNTANEAPNDFMENGEKVNEEIYEMVPFSAILLKAETG